MTDHADPAPTRVSWAQRLSDRLNPLLVRETQQVLSSKAFIVLMSTALAAICAVAFYVGMRGATGQHIGREAFTAALVMLVPIATFFIPLQAFVSMSQELRAGVSEQLLLSRLTPGRIVRGKIVATMVQLGLFLSVFGPLLAMTFLLRGTDVPTILFFLAMAVLVSVLAVAFAITMGAVSRIRVLTPVVFGLTSAGLAGITGALMAASWELVNEVGRLMRDSDFWLGMGVFVTASVCGLVLLMLMAGSLLTHAHENRSTPFRVFWIGLLVVALIWIVSAVSTNDYHVMAPALVIMGAASLIPIWWFALTEEEPLSPRVAAHLPRNRWMAVAAAPLLPGGGRGVLFVIGSSALVWGVAAVLRATATGSPRSWVGEMWGVAFAIWAYAFFYCGLGRLVRGRMRAGLRANWVARAAALALLALGCMLPLFVELALTGTVHRWHLGHVSNPFWTLERPRAPVEPLLLTGGIACGLVLLSMLPAARRGLREVTAARR